MKKNILLLVILVVFGTSYFGMNYISEKNKNIPNKNITFDFSKLKFDDIKTKNFEIKNKKIVSTGSFLADKGKVNDFINDLKSVKILSIASTNKSNFKNFGITGSGTNILIDNNKIFLGSMYSYNKQYIKINNDNKIYLIDKNFYGLTSKKLDFFRKKESGTGKILSGTGENLTGTGKIKIKK